MKNESREVNKYPSREKYLTNFAITTWLEERYKKVLAGGNSKRIAKYKGMTATKLLVEEPRVFDRGEGYFRSTIIARKNGLLFPDPKIDLPTFDEFLEHIDPDKKLYGKEGISKSLTFDELDILARTTTSFPSTNEYALTKIDGSDKYALLVFSNSLLLDLDEIFKTVFDEYMFQKIKGYSLDRTDRDYPKKEQTTLEGYIVGSIDVNEILLQEESVTIDILNINLIKSLTGIRDRLYNGDFTYNGEITYSSSK